MEMVGFNQINTVFDPEYVCVQSLQGYDRIAHYYFCPGEYDSGSGGSDNGSDNDD